MYDKIIVISYKNITLAQMQTALARIFHTDRDEEAAKLGWGKADEHFDAGLYVYILSKSQCESNATSTLASRSPQVIGVKHLG